MAAGQYGEADGRGGVLALVVDDVRQHLGHAPAGVVVVTALSRGTPTA
ncbi:hypothetical protein SLI_5215 [Streptomyces lividans 1326]|uniref:Uncharacterized protein n=1 Tax=Streptomyces lividans 1326 TaxID=1200984 RepID=A0A7U9HDK6_STRLI|nr:hypothetical protein SLI_5215 [Streptomyces lividans 1326]